MDKDIQTGTKMLGAFAGLLMLFAVVVGALAATLVWGAKDKQRAAEYAHEADLKDADKVVREISARLDTMETKAMTEFNIRHDALSAWRVQMLTSLETQRREKEQVKRMAAKLAQAKLTGQGGK